MNKPKDPKPVPITNHGTTPRYVGGRMIPPGQTRIFNPGDIPGHTPAAGPANRKAARAPAPKAPAKPVIDTETPEALVANSAKDIIAVLPDLADEPLAELERLEEARGKDARKTVLEAISREQVQRAEVAKLREEFAEHDTEALQDLLAATEAGSVEHGLIGEEIERRQAQGAGQ